MAISSQMTTSVRPLIILCFPFPSYSETCIKGHRSSSCKHTDRPLFEIKKKGRPITQCEHCRELRKTRQIHVKCVCESKDLPEEGLDASGSKGVLMHSMTMPALV